MKFIKNNIKVIIVIIITILLTSSISIYGTYKYFAKDIAYTPSDASWNVDNVEDALNELYNRDKKFEYIKTLRTGKDHTDAFSTIVVSSELEKGEYILVISRVSGNGSVIAAVDNNTGTIGTLTGATNYEVLSYSVGGVYNTGFTAGGTSFYATPHLNVYRCELEETATISYSVYQNDDVSLIMHIFKI